MIQCLLLKSLYNLSKYFSILCTRLYFSYNDYKKGLCLQPRSLKRINAIVIFFVSERISSIGHALFIVSSVEHIESKPLFKNNNACCRKCMRQEACIITKLKTLTEINTHACTEKMMKKNRYRHGVEILTMTSWIFTKVISLNEKVNVNQLKLMRVRVQFPLVD